MHQNMPKPIHKLGVAILTTVMSGLTLTIYNIFTQRIPDLETRTKLLENKVINQNDFIKRIDHRTQKIYEILLDNK